MARNTGTGGRTGIISGRTQTYNPKTGQYMKKDENGKFLSGKDSPYKNVRRDTKAKQQEVKDEKKKN